jgi:hypothetical protein
LAVRAHVPIMVEESVIRNAGITPEADVETSAGTSAQRQIAARPTPPVGDVSKERLSVFEDFLGKLDLDKLDKDRPEGGDTNPDDQEGGDKSDEADRPDKPKKPKKK